MKEYLKPLIPFIVFFGIIYTPQFDSYDIVGPQWFLLAVVSLVFIFLNLSNLTNALSSSVTIRIYLSFLIFAFFSFIYARNVSLFFHDFARTFVTFILVIIFILYIKKGTYFFRNFSILISFFLLYEVIYSLNPIIIEIYNNGLKILDATSINLMSLRGVTGNKNIAAASISLKSVFAIYLLFSSKNIKVKFIYFILIFFTSLNLFMLSARASLLSFFFILLLFLVYSIFKFYNSKSKSLLISLFFLIGSITSSFVLSNILLPNENITVANRISSIEFTNESSSKRLELWQGAIDFIYNNPLIGCGLGNWKIESAYYMRNSGADYLIPYHAHNDFLEITTELGIVGGFLYLLIFFSSGFLIIQYFIKSKFELHFLVIIAVFSVYIIDSLLNFPMARPIMQVPFAFVIAFIASNHKRFIFHEK